MNHDHVLFLDERHANLLSPILLLFAVIAALAMWAERRRHGWLVVAAAAVGAVVMEVTAGLGQYAAQWVLAAAVGMMLERRFGRWR